MGFSADIEAFTVKVKTRNNDLVRATVLGVAEGVISMSPVDTGVFRSNWFVSFGAPSEETTSLADKSGMAARSRALQAVATLQAGGVSYVTNNLPYGPVLEFGGFSNPGVPHWHPGLKRKVVRTTPAGFSTQAPVGMARVTAMRWRQIVEKAAAALG